MGRVEGAMERIEKAVRGWEGVTVEPHRFGGREFRLGKRELGHIHGDSLVDIPFPLAVRNELVEARKAEPHHIMPESGWISFTIASESSVTEAIALLRRSYELAARRVNRAVGHTEEKEN